MSETAAGTVVVAGEALIDVIVAPDGSLTASPGGGPYTVARTIGRLGVSCAFLGRLSDDRFGTLLRSGLDEAGVAMELVTTTDAPTTLALAEVDERGAASYRFYVEGTSAFGLSRSELPRDLDPEVSALHVGTLGLVVEPMASGLADLVERASSRLLVMADPNCRPQAIADRDTYLARLTEVLRRSDVVKVSTEDLAYLRPGYAPIDACLELIGLGPRVVLLTDGAHEVAIVSESGRVTVPVRRAKVVDTVGAGDAFGGGFLARWVSRGCGRDELGDIQLLVDATEWAIEVAALTCQRAGADPPRLADMGGVRAA